MSTYILSFTCPDGRGIIHAITGALLTVNANVLEQEQYSDPDSSLFFARTRFVCDEPDVHVVRALVEEHLAAFDARISIRREDAHSRALIMEV